MALLRLLIVLALLTFLGERGHAAVFHVSASGSDTPPYSSLATAANRLIDASRVAVVAGDTILIHAGEYEIDSTVLVANGVSVTGISRDSVVLIWVNPTDRPSNVLECHGAHTFSGFTVDYPKGSSFNSAIYAIRPFSQDTVAIWGCRFFECGVLLGSTGYCAIYDNEFLHGHTAGIYTGFGHTWIHDNLFVGGNAGRGVKVYEAGTAVIEANVFDNRPPRGGRTFAGVEIDFALNVIVRNNLIRHTEHAVKWYYASGVLENNTIIDADRGTMRTSVFQRYYESLSIQNNLFLFNRSAYQFGLACGDCDSTGWITFAYNAFWPPVDTFYWIYPGDPPSSIKIFPYENFNAYPMLTPDSASQLQFGSPLIDAGEPSILDADGSRSDIGWTGGPAGYSYEYLDLAPLPPDSLRATNLPESITLSWAERPESDLAGYRVYRGTSPDFWNPALLPMATVNPDQTSWQDTSPSTENFVYYVITAYDATGFESEPSAEVEVNLSAHPPEWAQIPDQSVRVGDTLIVEVSATDADGDSLVLMQDSTPVNTEFTDLGDGTGRFEFWPTVSQIGHHDVRLLVSDGALVDTMQISIEVLPEPHPPVWSPIPDQELLLGDTLSVVLTATDMDSDSLMFSLLVAPENSDLSSFGATTVQYVFTPESTQTGTHNVVLEVSDGALADTASFGIVVRGDVGFDSSTRIVKVYPNPLRSVGSVEVNVAGQPHDGSTLEIVICDILGRTIAIIPLGEQVAGRHVFSLSLSEHWRTADLASGVYLVLLKVDSKIYGHPYKLAVIH